MKRFLFFMLLVTMLAAAPPAHAQVDWRFGLEWNEGTLLGWSDPVLEQLLGRLEKLDTPGGGINVNGQGSWAAMQKSASDTIDFATTDAIVRLFQRFGFSFTWYLRCDAPWAFPSKPDCQPDTTDLPDPFPDIVAYHNCAPEPAFESDWINYIKAVVERYDKDGNDDMPDLDKPIQFYIQQGEIKFGMKGTGDDEAGPFWFDTIDNLLRLHRITYQAIREADPTGNSRVVSSGALLWDLYADFPDWPEFDPNDPNSIIRKRLSGENYKGGTYTAGWDSLKKMLDSFGNDADGIECDYIGWHPHFTWRVIDQEFAFIRAHAGNKPIYVDDMWANLFAQGYLAPLPGIPGLAQFNAPANPFAGTDWVKRINGDFPNSLFPGIDPYATLHQKLNQDDQAALDWYYATGARRLVKSFASAFGEGAERVSFSGTNDVPRSLLPHTRGWPGGWLNLLGTREQNYFEKPQFYTLKLLVEKLNDFTTAAEIKVSDNPRTRVYEFDRPRRGPVYILWSETGDAPPDLNYRVATGETITLKTKNNAAELLLTPIITDTVNTEPEVKIIPTQNGLLTIQLGYEPIFLEGDFLTDVAASPPSPLPSAFELAQNYPNPFPLRNGSASRKSGSALADNFQTVIEYRLSRAAEVEISIFNLRGQKVATLVRGPQAAGRHKIIWDGEDESGRRVASGVYLYRLKADKFTAVKKMLVLHSFNSNP